MAEDVPIEGLQDSGDDSRGVRRGGGGRLVVALERAARRAQHRGCHASSAGRIAGLAAAPSPTR